MDNSIVHLGAELHRRRPEANPLRLAEPDSTLLVELHFVLVLVPEVKFYPETHGIGCFVVLLLRPGDDGPELEKELGRQTFLRYRARSM